MYYTGAGSAATRRISFPVSIADGEQHRILLSARGLTVALKIDDAKPILRTLQGAVQDCGVSSRDCVLYVGQRSSASGGVYGFRGIVSRLLIFPSKFLLEHPTPTTASAAAVNEAIAAAGVVVTDWLDPINHRSEGAVSRDGVFYFSGVNGTSGLRITNHALPLVTTFSVAIAVMTRHTGTSGYLFAKTNGDGRLRCVPSLLARVGGWSVGGMDPETSGAPVALPLSPCNCSGTMRCTRSRTL